MFASGVLSFGGKTSQALEEWVLQAGGAAQTGSFRDAYGTLTGKLRPKVKEYGFLK